MRWHRRPAVVPQARWLEQAEAQGTARQPAPMQCIFLTAFCGYVAKVMESGHQGWEKTRWVTVLDKEWNAENWREPGNVIWIKKKENQNPQTNSRPGTFKLSLKSDTKG